MCNNTPYSAVSNLNIKNTCKGFTHICLHEESNSTGRGKDIEMDVNRRTYGLLGENLQIYRIPVFTLMLKNILFLEIGVQIHTKYICSTR